MAPTTRAGARRALFVDEVVAPFFLSGVKIWGVRVLRNHPVLFETTVDFCSKGLGFRLDECGESGFRALIRGIASLGLGPGPNRVDAESIAISQGH